MLQHYFNSDIRVAHPPDSIKQTLKANINPVEINVWIKIFKSWNGGVKRETNSKQETETLE